MLDFGGSYNSATVFKHIVMSHNGSRLNGFALVFVCVCVCVYVMVIVFIRFSLDEQNDLDMTH